MIAAVSAEHRDSIKGVSSLNFNDILANLAEMKANGHKKPFSDKRKEVRVANLRAASNLDKSMFDVNKTELLTEDILYLQETANLQVMKNLVAAQKRVTELKAAKEKVEELQDAGKETDSL
ncbi:uncharacterized protein LOC110731954 [Chenopodium quinoa]|uniref:uncharacterized protein LOC110731954 n=1 Tax=Chenopodium quinoa TaxID=63459 RepID=UPI000B77C53B|nr:uncharacterized protein LOC110731954 [Chenopodium quinoa]